MKKAIVKFFMCTLIGDHDWTSPAQEGVIPTIEKDMDSRDFKESFYNNCRMTCKRCNHESELSVNFKNKLGL